MPAPRLSQSAEAAKAAALQAEFNEKKWVWVPDDKEGYLSGWVIREEGDMGEVVLTSGEVSDAFDMNLFFNLTVHSNVRLDGYLCMLYRR